MKNTNLIILAAICFVSCGGSRNITAPEEKNIPTPATENSSAFSSGKILENNEINYTSFSAKAEIESQNTSGKNPGLVVKIQMKKNEYIWASIQSSFIGIEVARLYVFKDSVVLIDKIKREITHRPITYLQQLTKLPLNLGSMQDLLIGNALQLCNEKVTAIESSNGYALSSTCTDRKVSQNFDKLFGLIYIKMEEENSNRNFKASQEEFKTIDGNNFPALRQYYFEDNDKMSATIIFTDVEFNKDLSVSFSMPENYRRK